jgi:hypothetical protein
MRAPYPRIQHEGDIVAAVVDEFAMSRLVTTTHYDARVLVARLGSEGLVAEARESGGAAYPGGPVQVWVLTSQLEHAQELLSPEPLDWEEDEQHTRRVTKRFGVFLLFGLILMIAIPVARVLLS